MRFSRRMHLLIVALTFVSVFTGCGSSNQSQVTQQITAIAPTVAAVVAGGTIQFQAQYNPGPSAAGTIWSVNGVANGTPATGTITTTGLYIAPQVSAPTSFTIQASLPSGSPQSATVTVLAPGSTSATQNPLVARYSFNAPAGSTVYIEFGPDTSYGFQTSSQTSPAGGGPLSILVAGMRAATTYHMRADVTLENAVVYTDPDRTFTTGSLQGVQFPSLTTTTSPGMAPNSGVELLDFVTAAGNEPGVLATDLSGNVIWYLPAPPATPNPIKMLPDGDMLINYSSGPADGLNSTLEEVDLAGDVVWQMTAADLNQALAAAGYNLTVVGTHHDVAILPSGHLIVIASTTENFNNLAGYPGTTTVTGDVLIDLDANRKPVWTWSSFDYLDVNRHPLSLPDWTHTNTVFYSPSDGDLVISMRNQHWVIKIDYDNGQGSGNIVWKLGWQGDFTLEGGTDPVDWFFAQHDASITSTNTSGTFQFMVMDNGDNRVLNDSGQTCTNTTCYSTVPIFQVDESAKTATIIWRDDLQPVYNWFGGYAQILANGDVEFDECATSPYGILNSSLTAAVYEVTHETSPQTVWQMQITGAAAYRAFRIPSLYPGVQW